MKLRNYEGKTIVVELSNKKTYRGKVLDFIFSEDNNPPKNSLIMKAIGYEYILELYEDEIESIEIIG